MRNTLLQAPTPRSAATPNQARSLSGAFTAFGPLPDPMKPGFHCVRTHWIRGFMAFQLARRTQTVMLMVAT
jgi:hypothetical protein